MRLLTWNVNGLRSLIQYHPWCEHKNYQTILETLDADIICFQETKITLDRLESSIAIIPGYDAYFSFAKGKPAYSGVVTYVKTSSITPVAAEEGITGLLNQPPADIKSPFDNNESLYETRISSGMCSLTTDELLDLDSEGRCVILDFQMFILFNLYCPHESSSERLPFKMNFYKVLQARVEALLRSGRQVIILGDINVTHKEIDHCDPQRAVREQVLESFSDHPARKWFDGFVAPNGPMVDLFRMFHPDEKGMYTCWNTVINARPSNYGTRLDYILVSQGLVKWFKSCSVEQNVMGSDHCPVVAELYDEIKDGEHKYILGNEINLSTDKNVDKSEALRLCAKYLPKFNGSQQTLKSFFSKSGTKNINSQPGDDSDAIKTSSDNLSKSKNVDSNIDNNFGSQTSKASKYKSVVSKSTKVGGHKQKQKSAISSNQPSLISYFKQSTQTELSTSKSKLQNNEPSKSVDEMPHNLEEFCSEIHDTSNTLETASKWNSLFTPRPIPTCEVHGETCKEYKVNKSGPNQGRRFYLCSRPVGPSENDRCNFFEWAKGNKNASSGISSRSTSFDESEENDKKPSKKKRTS